MGDALAYFRGREDAERGRVLLQSDPDLVLLAAAWSMSGVVFSPPGAELTPEEAPDTELAAWLLLWSSVEVDSDAHCAASGVDPANYRYLMNRAIFGRLLYPDGTLPGFVSDAIDRASVMVGMPKGLG
jgi:hypothetical protein